MSSTSSLCSSVDDNGVENRIPPSLRRDLERFSVFISRLRSALDENTPIPDGESMYVCVHSALEMVSESMRDLFKYPQFKTNKVILSSLQLVQSVKELKFDNPNLNMDFTKVLTILDQLESAVLNAIIVKHIVAVSPPVRHTAATMGRKPKLQSTAPSTDFFSTQPRSASLVRRHSTYQPDPDEQDDQVMDCDRELAQRIDGVEIAFERTKSWSRYCKELTTFVKTRLNQEYEHARKVSQLVEQSRAALNEDFLPLRDLFWQSFDLENEHLLKVRDTQEHLNDRFIKALECRRCEHEAARRSLKAEYTKVLKSLQDAEAEHRKAQQGLITKEDSWKKARESTLRTESYTPGMNVDQIRRKKEMNKKKKQEDEAMIKHEDPLLEREEALQQVKALDLDVKRKRKILEKCKEKTIERLRELVYQCDQTTKACTQHYFKALSQLWIGVPDRLQELADATRDYQPGQQYMAFLQNLPPHRANSQHSLLRSDKSLDDLSSQGEGSSVTSLRRNALNPDDTGALPDTRRHKKTSSAGRLYESSELSDAALSHRWQRNSRPAKCAHCDTLSILFTVSCAQCGQNWHKNCFPKIAVSCGQNTRSPQDRRISMFGVSLQKQLEEQHRDIPLILEEVVHEIQRRGLRTKGLYRTCGVKSKIEEICELFERHTEEEKIPLDTVHPMNLASVVKLYLRKLPEPLMTFDLYPSWVRFGKKSFDDLDEADIDDLCTLIEKLPAANYETLKFLLLHLNRVSWFSECNLMTSSNLSTVIAPSLCWALPTLEAAACIQDTQYVNRTVEAMIQHAFTLFNVDRCADWNNFFSKYSLDEPSRPDDQGDLDEENDEEEDDELDDDHVYAAQPPTPDLLKNARKGASSTATSEAASEDAGSSSRWKDNSSEEGVCTESGQQPGTPNPPRGAHPRLRSRDHRRSYTTSILISPAVAGTSENPQLAKQQSEDNHKTSVMSGDVVLDVSEGQYFVCENGSSLVKDSRNASSCRIVGREMKSKEYGSNSGDLIIDRPISTDSPRPMSAHNSELFSGTADGDVSYV